LVAFHEHAKFFESAVLLERVGKSNLVLFDRQGYLLSVEAGLDHIIFIFLIVDDHLILVYLLYFIIGPLHEIRQFTFAENDLNVLMRTAWQFSAAVRFPCFLQGKGLAIIVLKTIKDKGSGSRCRFLITQLGASNSRDVLWTSRCFGTIFLYFLVLHIRISVGHLLRCLFIHFYLVDDYLYWVFLCAV
jgi:hypothetical protein